MATGARPCYGLVLLSVVAGLLSLPVAATVSAWALLVLPAAVVVGCCAWRGMGLAQTWAALSDASGDDLGRGPAGMSP